MLITFTEFHGTFFRLNLLKVVLVIPLEVLGCGDPGGGADGDWDPPDGFGNLVTFPSKFGSVLYPQL